MAEDGGARPRTDDDFLEVSAGIVVAYISHNALSSTDLPKLIVDAHNALKGLYVPERKPVEVLKPAVPVRNSVTPDHIICLEDGRKFKSMKRHLRTRYNLTPAQYRERWGLPWDYPMVAPNYSAARSRVAKEVGLGRKAGQ